MRFLADESCDSSVIRALRNEGHDVLSVAESRPGADDELVIEQARTESRVLLTEDKDFGRLFYAAARQMMGVVLRRYPFGARQRLASNVVRLAADRPEALQTSFVVVEPGRIRIGKARQA